MVSAIIGEVECKMSSIAGTAEASEHGAECKMGSIVGTAEASEHGGLGGGGWG